MVNEARVRDQGRSAHERALRDPRVQRAAARLRVVTDRRLGKVTPQWVLDLAADDDAPVERGR